MRTLLVTLLLCAFTTASSQIVVTHFNAPWNDHNKADWIGNLKGCDDIAYVNIVQCPEICKKHKIRTVPTIIIFKDGVEVKRFHGGLNFNVNREATESKIQEIIYQLQPYPEKNPVL